MMASPDVSNLGEIEWTYTLSFRVTYCRNGNELLIVGFVAPHSPSPVRMLTSQHRQYPRSVVRVVRGRRRGRIKNVLM
jgi:hypothetical protein